MSNFTQYNNPNIVIVPTKSLADDPCQKSQSEADSKSPTDETNKSIPILIQGITSNSESCSDMNSYANMSSKNESWGSNFFESCGLPYENNRRESMNNNQENARFQHHDPSLATILPNQSTDVNLQTAAPNISYTYGQSSSVPGTTFMNYNIASNTGVIPEAYPGSFENNNYYYGQPINTAESGCCTTCCGLVENIPNTYMNTYNQSTNVGNNSSLMTYYNTNTLTLAPSVNLLHSQSYAFIDSNTQSTNNFGQPVNSSGYNTNTSQTPCEDNRCPTPLFDEYLLTPQFSTCINAYMKMASIDNSKIEEKTCDCTCSKRNPAVSDKPNSKTQNKTDNNIEHISSVQANEKAFREFLRKLKIDRPSEKEKKQTNPSKSPPHMKKLKKSKTKAIEKSSVQENEKAFRKLLQKVKMDYKSETAKSENKHNIGKNISKSTTTSNEKTKTCSENKVTEDPEQNEKERPKFIKTKYVDKQEPEYKPTGKAILDTDYDKYSKTRSITTKYVDKQEPYYKQLKKKMDVHEIKRHSKSVKYLDEQEFECRPIKKGKYSSDYEIKKYSTVKAIPTKYVDEQEPKYKPLKKAKYESDYELKKYSNSKTKYEDTKKREIKQIKKTRIDSSEFTKRSKPEYDLTNKVKRVREESDSSDNCCKKYKSDYKIKTYKSESTKYYKYRSQDGKESRKQTPVKSVVKISKTCELKKSPLHNSIDKEDLRDKLSRKIHAINKEHEEDIPKRIPSEESDENLIITVNNNVTENNNSPLKLTDQLKTKTDSCKKINLVINIVYKQPGSRRESEKRESESHSPQANVDLSFLDDFNVDEIVASLKTENVSTQQNSQSETSNFVSSGEGESQVDTSNVFIKQDNLEISKAKMILEKGDLLNNLLSKESSIIDTHLLSKEPSPLDTLRNMNEEVKNESINNEQNVSLLEIPIPKDKCADTMLKLQIKEETAFIQSRTKNLTENNIISTENTSLSPLGVLMRHVRKIDAPNDLSQALNYGLLEEETISLTENNLNSYEHGMFSFDEEEKRRQTELMKVLEDTKEDEKTAHVMDSNHTSKNTPKTAVSLGNVSNDIKNYDDDVASFEEDITRQSNLIKILDEANDGLDSFKMKDNTVLHAHTFSANDSDKECSKLTIIDISSDDSNDSCTTKQSKDKYSDDVYIVEEKSGKNVIETIDLTIVENLNNQILTPSLATSTAFNRRENESVSYNPDIKENKKTITTNKGLPNVGILSNGKQNQISSKNILSKELASDICVNNNKSIDTGTQISQKIVTAIKDAIDSLKTIENLKNAVDKSTKDGTKALPMNNQKETLDIANNEVKDVSLNQIMMQQIQDDTQTGNTITISMEDETNAKKAMDNELKEIKEKEKYALVPPGDNKVNYEIEKGKHETVKNHFSLKENDDIQLTKKQINIVEKTISDEASNMKVEKSLLPQAEIDGKNKNNSSKDTELEKSVNKISMEDCTTVDGKNEISSYKDSELEDSDNKISMEDCTTSVPTVRIVSCDKHQENGALVVNNVDTQIVDFKAEVNSDDKQSTAEEDKCLKGKLQNKTDSVSLKIMPSTSVTTINTPSPAIKKSKPNLKAVDVKVDNVHKKSPTLSKDQKISKIAGNLEREMLTCFNQNYTANGLIHSGTFSKIFHFTSYSGLQYAVKSYNDSQSIYKYADKKDMMFALQEGLMRYSYGGVFLINSFSLQGRLCLLMDYYPKNLKQALAENGKPFHINVVQHLARQLVSAVMLLKSHDVVHLDIKPTHILLNYKNKKLKLCGFDAARPINKIAKLPNLGTVNYRPPEVIVGYKIGFDVDVWATALVLYEMATGTMLFPGMYNNDILFKQMCTLGALPVEMLNRAHFSQAHFTGCSFKRIMGKKGNKINIITKFYKTKRLETTIIKAYNDNWRSSATEQQFMVDKEKIMSFTALLREMLNVDPGDRMPIQFVNTHSFITNEW